MLIWLPHVHCHSLLLDRSAPKTNSELVTCRVAGGSWCTSQKSGTQPSLLTNLHQNP